MPGARARMQNGATVERSYFAGETQHESYGLGQSKMHDVENTAALNVYSSQVLGQSTTTSRTPPPSMSTPPRSSPRHGGPLLCASDPLIGTSIAAAKHRPRVRQFGARSASG